jgi:hypothetical protein
MAFGERAGAGAAAAADLAVATRRERTDQHALAREYSRPLAGLDDTA